MSDIDKLLEIMARLRDPDTGCPWDLEQDFSTIAPYTIEEAYEVADAIAREDMPALRDELGDLLFQVVFYARMASETGAFEFSDIVGAICDKMLRRHPHVFGSDAERAAGPAEGSWERIKAEERGGGGDEGALAGVAKSLPALKRAQKLGKRAAGVGFDWPDRRGVREKIAEELEELEDAVGTRDPARVEEEFGDLLFAVVNLARHLDVDAENALTGANRKFERRFAEMEKAIRDSGGRFRDHNLESLDREWRAAKRRLS
ncbi:MAG TPA: nucleoside triphosphate pyrophosphohydrolase [Woeseiaceae bacterium]|nr:nucleoside triphosphate pyrophosphohydrolase [Woeseiaceae bacterium]